MIIKHKIHANWKYLAFLWLLFLWSVCDIITSECAKCLFSVALLGLILGNVRQGKDFSPLIVLIWDLNLGFNLGISIVV